MIGAGIANDLAFDANALAALQRQAKDDPRTALAQAARQFEAVFLQTMLKAMRESVPRAGMLDSDAGRMYEGLLDQQLAQVLANRAGTGLAAELERQLARSLPPAGAGAVAPGAEPRAPSTGDAPASAVQPAAPAAPDRVSSAVPERSREFVDRLWPHAIEASRATGIPARFLIAQAALETGWGRAELRLPDGSVSHNLFNVKAGRDWTGATVEATTTEYVAGKPRRQVERFRAYASYGEAFADYARLIRARYASALGAREPAAFATALQRGGYATDPAYAAKLTRIIDGQALRASLAG